MIIRLWHHQAIPLTVKARGFRPVVQIFKLVGIDAESLSEAFGAPTAVTPNGRRSWTFNVAGSDTLESKPYHTTVMVERLWHDMEWKLSMLVKTEQDAFSILGWLMGRMDMSGHTQYSIEKHEPDERNH